jgi:hypothetical protein
MTGDLSVKIAHELGGEGFAFVEAGEMRRWLGASTLEEWNDFAESWNDLGLDTYMADGGRYRRRRFSVFEVSESSVVAKPHQPHYQSRDYNQLNGGIERWFAPFAAATASHPVLLALLRACHSLFTGLTRANTRPKAWHVECHQFRIEAKADVAGQPTPEGLHRDGVDWVLVLLVARTNIAEGVTTIYDLNRKAIGHFTLTRPLDAAFVDDSRVYHGVTAVQPIDRASAACRDVLVVTFRRQ